MEKSTENDRMDKSKIRVVYEYEFRNGTTISDTTRNINKIFGEGATTKTTVSNWFGKFKNGNYDLTNERRGRPETKVDNEKLKILVESNPTLSTRELATVFDVSIPTILAHLAQIGKVNKMSRKGKLD